MNKVILMGRLTRDPEVRYTQTNNTLVASFSLAVNRRFVRQGEERQADFINIVAWRKQAETICNYFDKGNQIAIEGRLQTGSYDDKDGNKRYTIDVALENFEFIESKAAREATAGSKAAPTPYDYQDAPKEEVNVEDDPFAEFGDSVSIDDNFLE